MLSLPPSVRIFVACGATDLRKSFDTLSVLVKDVLHQDPLSGHLFAFFNRRKDRVKLLVWDRTGFWLFYKRLEEGTFAFPAATGDVPQVEMTAADLQLVLQGIDPTRVKRSRRYQRPTPVA